MPRPSDVYATFGAPGVYQATPCTPSRLPNVYVFPPEEDNQDVYCLFHSGSASPTTFESFYNHPVYTQRDPNSPTLTDLRALNNALSCFQRHSATHNSPRYGSGRSWEHDKRIQTISRNYPRSTVSSASSRSSLSEPLRRSSEIEGETSVYSNIRLGEAKGQHEEQWQCHLPSRRSSVFGDRPLDYEVFKSRVREDDQPETRQSQTMTFRNRAAMAFKGLGSAMIRRLEGHTESSDDGSAMPESWFHSKPSRKKRTRHPLTQPLNSNVDIPSYKGGVHLEVAPKHSSSSVRDPKLVKRKSMIQLFSRRPTSMMENGTGTNSAYPRPDLGHPAARSSSSLASPVAELKLFRRKSMAQLLGMGRVSSTELSDHTIVAVDADETSSEISEAPGVAAPQPLEGPYACSATARVHTTRAVQGSQSLVSLATSGPTAPTGGRKSLLRRRGFSFLGVHRHFATDHGSRPSSQVEHTPPAAPTIEPSGSFSPDSLSEGTDSSSSLAASTECEQTIEDDMHFPVPHLSTIMGQSGVALAKDFEPNLSSRSQLDLHADIEDTAFSVRFRLEATGDDVESETAEDPPMLELGVRLDSLTFDQLVFDPESFTGSVHD